MRDLDTITTLDSANGFQWEIAKAGLEPLEYFQNPQKFSFKKVEIPSLHSVDGKTDTVQKSYERLKFAVPRQWDSPHLSLRLGVITDSDITFLNGHKIGQSGKLRTDAPQAYDKIREYAIPSKLIRPGEENELVIYSEGYFPGQVGIISDTTAIGPTSEVDSGLIKDEFVKLILLTVYATVAGYFLFLFIRRPQDKSYLYFALFAFLLVIYQFFRNQLKYDLGWNFYYMKKSEYLVLFAMLPIFLHFVRTYFGYKMTLILRIMDAAMLLAGLFILFTSNVVKYNDVNKMFIQPIWIAYLVHGFYYLIQKSRRRNMDAVLILVGVSIVCLALVTDILSDRGVINFPRTVGYVFIAFILSLATILANKFVRVSKKVEELNLYLEKKVEERTSELNQSLEEIKRLKVKQDGDYFLTSLLLKPLMLNGNSSGKIRTTAFSRQFKQFEFKQKQYEIGGDIIVTDNLELENQKFMVFINGDAMGKSMQGAGGALVLGVLFNTIVTRTQAEGVRINPDIWLHEVFLEFQRTFESFDGSMIVSAVLGLIDESTNHLSYWNAEHPWTILFRDNKAEFLDQDLTLRKLGFPMNDSFYKQQTFQLQEKDAILIGSDGRDDIKIGEDNTGRIINEDETLFLKIVEDAGGDLSQIVDKIHAEGELTDDLTILKIESISAPEANTLEEAKGKIKERQTQEGLNLLLNYEKTNPNNSESLRLIALVYYREKDWKNSSIYFAKLFRLEPFTPSEEDLLFYSHSLAKEKKFSESLDISMRLFHKNPEHLQNLIQLVQLEYKLGNREEANRYFNLLEGQKSDHPMVDRLKQMVLQSDTQ